MKSPFLLVAVSLLATALPQLTAAEYGDATPIEWSKRMADSEMKRFGNETDWDYTSSLLALSLLKLGERTGEEKYTKFAEHVVGGSIKEDGTIVGYKKEDFNIDMVNPGKVVLALYLKTKENRYKVAAEKLREQLAEHPRTSEGGFWHKKRYPEQMWLDGLYMGSPFYAQYGIVFDEPAAFDDVTKQILLMDKYAYDPKTGLYFHGWDEARKQPWADPKTGLSKNFWGRGLGWFAMALVDDLEFLPKDHPQRKDVLAVLNRVAEGVAKYQDPKTGLWWQVLDQGDRKGNYLEGTASSMFVYSLAKAINNGWLPKEKYKPVVDKGYAGIIRDLIRKNDDGTISLLQCCAVAGLGGRSFNKTHDRDGSFEYYINEPIIENDLKGVGPFILAGLEL
jgi:unsaturated rhamnogalacturonyl hydrolase